jgi:signal transduction histidine kinase
MRFAETSVGWLLAFERRADQAGFTDEEAQLLRAYASMAAASLATAHSSEDERIRRSIEASEQERARLARELHDQTLQGLGGMRVMLAYAAQSDDVEVMRQALDQAVADLGEEIDAVRRMSIDLRPAVLDDLGLGAALEGLIERHRATGILHLEAIISLDGDDEEPISPDSERTVYRLVQESLTNVVKHSGAARASVRVRRSPDNVAVEIEDDGCGFDTAQPSRGFGLSGMQERATMAGGSLRVTSEPGNGTTVRATVPARS